MAKLFKHSPRLLTGGSSSVRFQLILFLTVLTTTLRAADLTVLVSADGRGKLEPVVSDHTGLPMGGLARRAATIEAQRNSDSSLLLLEAGDFLFGDVRSKDACESIIRIYKEMDYDAINLSTADFRMGVAFTEDLLQRSKLPVVSCNLYYESSGKRLFEPYVIINRSGFKTAILGLTEPPRARSILPYLDQQLEGLTIQPLREALSDLLPELRKKSDHIVVLYAGSSAGHQQIRKMVEEDVTVIAVSGPGSDFVSKTGEKPILLAPRADGRELASARLSKDGATEKLSPIVLGPSLLSDPAIESILKPLVPESHSGALKDSRLIDQQNLRCSLPDQPERNRLYRIEGFMSNRGADIQLQAAGLFDQFGTLKARDGHVLLVLRSSWENTIPLILKRNQGLATTYLIPNLGDHLYVVVDGKKLSRVYAGKETIPDALPTQPLSLPYIGMKEEGNLIFEIPDGELQSINLRMYDYAHGHAQFDLKGTQPPSEHPVLPSAANDLVNSELYDFAVSDNVGSIQADPGTTFVSIDLRGKSLFSMNADASAFDPHAKAGARIDIGTVADWLEADQYCSLVVDGSYGFQARQDLSTLGANPRFLPDLMTGGRLVFQVPAEFQSLVLRADFPNARLPSGKVIRPNPIEINLEGTQPTPPSVEPIWQVSDDTLVVSILSSETTNQFAGTAPGQGKVFLKLDIAVANVGQKPEFFQTSRQLGSFDLNGRQSPPHAITYDGILRPYKKLWVPNGELRSFQVVFEIDANESEHRLSYQGFTLAETFAITAEGVVQPLTSETAEPETSVVRTESDSAPTNPPVTEAVKFESSSNSSPAVDGDSEMIEPVVERIAVTPYHLEVPIAQKEHMEAELKSRVSKVRTQSFFSNKTTDFEELKNQFGEPEQIDIEPEAGEDEPVQKIQLDQLYQGTLEEDGKDIYQFEISEEQAAGVLEFYIAYDRFEKETKIELRHEGSACFQEYVDQSCVLPQFTLVPGSHTLTIYYNRGPSEKNYRFCIHSIEKTEGMEIEFNDSIGTANLLELGESIQGRIDKRDTDDYFKVEINEDESQKVYGLDIISDHPDARFSLSVYDENERKIGARNSSDGVLSMAHFSPAPGTYYCRISHYRNDMSYRFEIVEKGRYVAGFEREPNDDYQRSYHALAKMANQNGPEMSGVFDGEERDHFFLDVKDASQIYTLSLSGSGVESIEYLSTDGRSKMWCSNDSEIDLVPALVDMKLPTGRNLFVVEGDGGDWGVNVESFPVPDGNFESEPNNEESWATVLKLGESYYGRLLDNSDDDHFKVTIHKAMNYQLTVKPGSGSLISVLIEDLATGSERFDMEEGELQLQKSFYLLPGNYDLLLEATVPSLENYEILLEPVPAKATLTGLQFEFDLDESVIAEHSDLYQFAKGSLILSNRTEALVEGTLSFQTTHYGIKLSSPGKQQIRLASGESLTIPLELRIDANVWNHGQVYLYSILSAEDGSTWVSQKTPLGLDPEQLAVGTEHVLQTELLPELIGGLNLASLKLGASPIEEKGDYPFENMPPSVNEQKPLFDGVIELNSFWGNRATIKLAGNGSIPLMGTSFELHGEGSLWESAKDVMIEISQDGKSWTEVWQGILEARTGNQQFLFAKEQIAQYARLTIQSANFPTDPPHLGEWRIISKPGYSLGGDPFDLLAPALGGHLIQRDDLSRVYGFHHDRAAKIQAMEWRNPYASNQSYKNVQTVRLLKSLSSPIGPWEEVGVFDVSGADNEQKTPTRVDMDQPFWARFVKLEWDGPEGEVRSIIQPDAIKLFEMEHSDDYFSLLGEWGDAYAKAGYEYAHDNEKQTIKPIESSESQPYTLVPDQTLSSAASVGEGWEDWFRIQPLNTEKRIELRLSSRPFIKVAVDISDVYGNSIEASTRTVGSQERVTTFMAEPQMEYRVHVYEPKRSIVFLWDVSGSMGAFVPSIENAILQFATAVDPQTEIVQLLPFEDKPKFLLENWTGDPYLLADTVRHYDAPDSSYAHINLLAATQKLANQKGTKAAIVITDCESSRNVNDQLWDALEEVQPVVFTFQTSDRTSQYDVEQDDMQDWAAVGGGFYRSTRNASELDIAFEKVKAFLRRPAPYTLGFSTPELKPGFIEVKDVRAKETIVDPTQEGILLIIDASASMREQLPDGQMKVSAAKKIIEEMVTEYLPKGSNFGMRVFGHRGGQDCASELMIPVLPVDPELVKQKLMFLRSSSLGNTSLAEGLSWAKEDLNTISGQKRVVVLTDGVETCHGDPAQAIADLAEEGLEVVVNIVGFTLGDESVKADYTSWVKATNGYYYDAQDSVALGEALKVAMTPKTLPDFKVIDKNGHVVFTAQVGSTPVEVKSGKYTVEIMDPEHPTTRSIQVMESKVLLEYQ